MTHTRLPEAPPQRLSNRQRKLLKNNLARHGFISYREYIRSQAWWDKKEHYRASGLPKTVRSALSPTSNCTTRPTRDSEMSA